MKKIRIFLLSALLCSTLGASKAEAQSAKARALGSMALYGTIGGTLLGTATLAFGSNARSIAQGASLGLYAGLIFGSYVVLSHGFQREYDDDYGSLYKGHAKDLFGSKSFRRDREIAHEVKRGKKTVGWNFYLPIVAMSY